MQACVRVCVCVCVYVCVIILSRVTQLFHHHLSLSLQGSAKLEKAEILQMTVDHLRHLHQSRDPRGRSHDLIWHVACIVMHD